MRCAMLAGLAACSSSGPSPPPPAPVVRDAAVEPYRCTTHATAPAKWIGNWAAMRKDVAVEEHWWVHAGDGGKLTATDAHGDVPITFDADGIVARGTEHASETKTIDHPGHDPLTGTMEVNGTVVACLDDTDHLHVWRTWERTFGNTMPLEDRYELVLARR